MTEGSGTDPDAALRLLEGVVEEFGGEARAEQVVMTEAVASSIAADENLVVQAGTGVGKSFAYLVPTFLAAGDGKRHIISTSSLALQRQIMEKDAPIVQRVAKETTGSAPDFAVLKGWSNYLCKYRLDGGLRDEFLWVEKDAAESGQIEVENLAEWAAVTETGDRDEVTFPVSTQSWQQVSTSKKECIGSTCPFASECFPVHARQQAFAADVVITNHSLLGVYANGRPEVLPEFDVLVIDEAHELPAKVRQQGSRHLTGGLISGAARALQQLDAAAAAELREVREDFDEVLDSLAAGMVRIRPDRLNQVLLELTDAVTRGRKVCSTSRSGARKRDAAHLARGRLDDLLETIDTWNGDPGTIVTWVEVGSSGAKQLHITPLNVAERIANKLLEDHCAVLTSATLKAGGTFQSFRYQSGLDLVSRPVREADVGTPFSPEKQAILYVASHLPPPGREDREAEFYDELSALTNASGGGMLGLFSSAKGMQAAAQYLREHSDLRVLLQGEDSLPSLLREFSAEENSCLIGTLSLWQGVDIPGRACRLVVIDRIPFPRPDDPVVQALGAASASRGRNAFRDVSLAPAAILLAQGAGRLLRNMNDRGVVAVLDSRIASRSYGEYLRASLPPFWQTRDPRVVREALSRLSAQPELERN